MSKAKKIWSQGGTPHYGSPSLCDSCRHAKIVNGQAESQRLVHCEQVYKDITVKVADCTEYIHRNHPSLRDMQHTAFILMTDKKSGTIGFKSQNDIARMKRENEWDYDRDERITVPPFLPDND